MDKDLKNLIRSYDVLFIATNNIVFKTASLYMQRTGNKILLPELTLTKEEDALSL